MCEAWGLSAAGTAEIAPALTANKAKAAVAIVNTRLLVDLIIIVFPKNCLEVLFAKVTYPQPWITSTKDGPLLV